MTDVIINDIFIKRNGFSDSVEETLLRIMEADLVKGIEAIEKGKKYDFDIHHLLECSHLKIDDKVVHRESEDLLNKISEYAKQYGINIRYIHHPCAPAWSIFMEKLNENTFF